MGYDTRVVAFIDILGFENALEKSSTDNLEFERIKNTLNELQKFFIKPKDFYEIEADKGLGADTQIMQVSDSLLISRLIQEQGGIYHMLKQCAFAIHLLISNGFLCRGAIKVGKLHHTESIMFGPAFVEAYNSELAEKLPIIKFDKEIFEIVKEFPGPANQQFEDWEVDFIKKNCKELETGEYYIDYFTDYDDLVGPGEGGASIHYENLRKIIVNGLTTLPESSNPYQKYLWAAQQFNLFAKRFSLDEI